MNEIEVLRNRIEALEARMTELDGRLAEAPTMKGETPDEVRADLEENGHGWVVPRKSGTVVRCGGPGMCGQCKLDRRRLIEAEHRIALTETGQGEGRR